MSTPAQQLANRQNAQHSTGPKSDGGKAISSKNAITTALTGRTVLLPSDDRERYEAHIAEYRDLFQPGNLYETNLVQAIADTDWRLSRIPHLILGLEARAQAEVIAEHAATPGTEELADPQYLNLGIEAYLRYERQINNLYTQEGRLHRRRAKDLAELQLMQSRRQQQRAAHLRGAAHQYAQAKTTGQPFHVPAIGFVFSVEEIREEAERLGLLKTAPAPVHPVQHRRP